MGLSCVRHVHGRIYRIPCREMPPAVPSDRLVAPERAALGSIHYLGKHARDPVLRSRSGLIADHPHFPKRNSRRRFTPRIEFAITGIFLVMQRCNTVLSRRCAVVLLTIAAAIAVTTGCSRRAPEFPPV